MYPPLALLIRECTQDYQIPETQKIIKKGVSVFIPIYGLHYDHRFYSEPYIFKPHRIQQDLPFYEQPY